MAFSTSGNNEKITHGDGLVGLHSSLPQYRAWKHWLTEVFQKRYFPDWITVTSEWPPTTSAAAREFAEWLSSIRDEIKVTKGVPPHPDPWTGFVPPAPPADAERAPFKPFLVSDTHKVVPIKKGDAP